MPDLSRRILSVKSSPTVALNAKAKALAKEGIKVLSFAVGEPDFATPDSVVEKAIASLKAGRTKYGPAGGSLEFRQGIAAKLARENGVLGVNPDDIVAGIGAKEILFHIFLAILNDGDEVLIPSPYWVSYPDQVLAAGARPVALPMPTGPGAADALARAPLRIEDLERRATAKTTAIILNSPNNPAGYVFDKSFLLELGAYLKTKSWWIISDEIYEYLAFDRPHESLLSLFPELKDRYILVNGMSKGFAMTGWRVGYAAGPSAVMKLVRDLQSHSSTCLPPFIEDAAIFALAQGRSLLAPEIEGLKARRDLAANLAKTIPGIRLAPPQGAFYLFLDCNEPLAKGISAGSSIKDGYALSEHLLMKHHIAMVPGEAFGAPGWLRLSYATDQATIKEGLARLKTALGELGRA